jgi:hypothetical protein
VSPLRTRSVCTSSAICARPENRRSVRSVGRYQRCVGTIVKWELICFEVAVEANSAIPRGRAKGSRAAMTLACCRRSSIARTGRMLGSFPQAFSHVGLINSAHNLSRQAGPAEERAESQTAPVALSPIAVYPKHAKLANVWFGSEPKCWPAGVVSALPPTADIHSSMVNVGWCQQRSFDHLVGADSKRGRYGWAKRPACRTRFLRACSLAWVIFGPGGVNC